jgi:hypothetical protein
MNVHANGARQELHFCFNQNDTIQNCCLSAIKGIKAFALLINIINYLEVMLHFGEWH